MSLRNHSIFSFRFSNVNLVLPLDIRGWKSARRACCCEFDYPTLTYNLLHVRLMHLQCVCNERIIIYLKEFLQSIQLDFPSLVLMLVDFSILFPDFETRFLQLKQILRSTLLNLDSFLEVVKVPVESLDDSTKLHCKCY